MNKFESIDKFKDALMDRFLSLCNYNDFDELNLLTISETISDVYDECIAEMVGDTE